MHVASLHMLQIACLWLIVKVVQAAQCYSGPESFTVPRRKLLAIYCQDQRRTSQRVGLVMLLFTKNFWPSTWVYFVIELAPATKHYPIIREIKWNAINLKCGNRPASRDVNFYKAFFQGFKPSGNLMKLYTVNKGTEKGFSGLFWTCVCFPKSYVTGLRRMLTYRVLCVPSLASLVD